MEEMQDFTRRNDILEEPQNNPTNAVIPRRLQPGFVRFTKKQARHFKMLLEKGVEEEEAKKQASLIPKETPAPPKPKQPAPPKPKQPANNMNVKRLQHNNRNTNNSGRGQGQGNRQNQSIIQYPNCQRRIMYGEPNRMHNNYNMQENSIIFRQNFPSEHQKIDPKQIRVGILPLNYPIDLLDNDKMKVIEDQIIKRIIHQNNSLVKPQFVGSVHKIGWLQIICREMSTVYWLKNLYNWASENLQVVDAYEASGINVFEALFPQSAEFSVEQVLDLIAGQNSGLNTRNWHIITEVVCGTGLHLIFAVDRFSMDVLAREKFKLYYKFTIVKIDQTFANERDLFVQLERYQSQPHNQLMLDGPINFKNRGTYNGSSQGNGMNDMNNANMMNHFF